MQYYRALTVKQRRCIKKMSCHSCCISFILFLFYSYGSATKESPPPVVLPPPPSPPSSSSPPPVNKIDLRLTLNNDRTRTIVIEASEVPAFLGDLFYMAIVRLFLVHTHHGTMKLWALDEQEKGFQLTASRYEQAKGNISRAWLTIVLGEVFRERNGVIMTLMTPHKEDWLYYTARFLSHEHRTTLARHYDYPLIIFHAFSPCQLEVVKQHIRMLGNATNRLRAEPLIYWTGVAHQLQPRLPNYTFFASTQTTAQNFNNQSYCRCDIGDAVPFDYVNMIHWRLVKQWEHPILSHFDYSLWLDSDALVLNASGDIFDSLVERRAKGGLPALGYKQFQCCDCAGQLDSITQEYIAMFKVQAATNLTEISPGHFLYGNFLIFNHAYWLAPQTQATVHHYIRYMESHPRGTWRNRWSEQVLYPLAIGLYRELSEALFYVYNVRYVHYGEEPQYSMIDNHNQIRILSEAKEVYV